MKRILIIFCLCTCLMYLCSCDSDKLNNNDINTKQTSGTYDVSNQTSKTTENSKQTSIPTSEQSTPLSTTNTAGAKADNFYIEEIVRNYERLFVAAINHNDFNAVKNLLMPDSDISKSQQKLVEEFSKTGIKEELKNTSIIEIKKSEKNYEYNVYVTSKIEITSPDKGKETKETKKVYTVFDDNTIRKIKDIQELK